MTLTQLEFARSQGWQHSYITELKNKGLLVMQGGKVHKEKTLKKLARFASPDHEGVRRRHAKTRAARGAQQQQTKTNGGVSPYLRAKIDREQIRAKSAEIDYRRQIGELIEVAQVNSMFFSQARVARNALMSLADKLAPLLAIESDTAKCHQIIADAVRELCEDISRGIAKLKHDSS